MSFRGILDLKRDAFRSPADAPFAGIVSIQRGKLYYVSFTQVRCLSMPHLAKHCLCIEFLFRIASTHRSYFSSEYIAYKCTYEKVNALKPSTSISNRGVCREAITFVRYSLDVSRRFDATSLLRFTRWKSSVQPAFVRFPSNAQLRRNAGRFSPFIGNENQSAKIAPVIGSLIDSDNP